MIRNYNLSIVKLLGTFLILFLAVQCKKEDEKGWTFYLDNPPAPEILNLSSSIKNCVPPYPVTFYQETDNLIGDVIYYWDFGDGNTSTNQNPTHIYDAIGSYEVMLRVSNEIGEDTMYLDMSELNQTSIPIEAEFSYEHFNDNNFAPAKVLFSNSSTGCNVFDWDFGDGGENNDDDPEYIFQSEGNYSVTLRGTCTNGEYNEFTQQIFINPAPTRVFIDSLNLMLPSSLQNNNIYVELYHNTTYVSGTETISARSYPYKFRNPEDFIDSPIFEYVQFAYNEVFKFLVIEEVAGAPDVVIYEIILSPVDIQNRHYPTNYYQIETVPPLEDVFIDLYLDY
jgi:PKD domain